MTDKWSVPAYGHSVRKTTGAGDSWNGLGNPSVKNYQVQIIVDIVRMRAQYYVTFLVFKKEKKVKILISLISAQF